MKIALAAALLLSATTAQAQQQEQYFNGRGPNYVARPATQNVNGQETYQGVPVYKSTGAEQEDFTDIPQPEEIQNIKRQPVDNFDLVLGIPQTQQLTNCGWTEVAMKTPDGSEFHQAQWMCFNGRYWVRAKSN